MRKSLDSVERVFAYVVTCGRELDDIGLPKGNFLKEYWLDTIKETVLDFQVRTKIVSSVSKNS